MSNENFNENQLENEEVIAEQQVEDVNDEVVVESTLNDIVEDAVEEVSPIETEKKGDSVIKAIFACVIDQVIAFALAILLVLLFDLVIRIGGYRVATDGRAQIALVMYAVANCLYAPIISKTKLGGTIGRNILGIK